MALKGLNTNEKIAENKKINDPRELFSDNRSKSEPIFVHFFYRSNGSVVTRNEGRFSRECSRESKAHHAARQPRNKENRK